MMNWHPAVYFAAHALHSKKPVWVAQARIKINPEEANGAAKSACAAMRKSSFSIVLIVASFHA
jgi:hypothetical protein